MQPNLKLLQIIILYSSNVKQTEQDYIVESKKQNIY